MQEPRRHGGTPLLVIVLRATIAFVLSMLAVPVLPMAALEPGDFLDRSNWQEAQGLLPEEFIAAYKNGDFRHQIGAFQVEKIADDPVFQEALKHNRGRYALQPDGTIVERESGQVPDYIYGWPFPDIDAKDPQAAMKIVWNYFYTVFYGGNSRYRADLLWISRSGLDRSIEVDSYVKHYQGQHPRFRHQGEDKSNQQDLLSQSLSEVLSPADVAGVVSLSWRYRQPDKRDSIWTYVPAMRRVRQISPANRSDGFLGSDLSQDDGPYFDGKVQDFNWKLIGEQDLLVLFDQLSFEQKAELTKLPDGGWRMNIPAGPRVGFQVPSWKGAPWCPTKEILIRRPHWIVEATPKDPYYLYGKIILRFDKDIFLGSYSTKYDWKGKLMMSYSAIRTNIVKPAPGELWGWAGGAVALAMNWNLDRATTAGIVAGKNVPADSRIPIPQEHFSLQQLNRRGR